MALFIVFEGIDGSGKTTISNQAARRLRETGLRVEHVREGGTFSSPVTQAIRELGRDARNLALAPLAELLLFATRDAQTAAESIRPALARADVVFADRFTATAEALARYGRGLDAQVIAPIVATAASGLAPDLTILVDVDPQIARARRRVSKLLATDRKAPSRKGLWGAGLQQRLREGYLELAARDPARWLVVDNGDAALDDVVARVTELVRAARAGVPAAIARARAEEDARRAARPAAPAVRTPAEARAALLAWIDRRAATEPGLAAWALTDVHGVDADARREALLARAGEVVAAGLVRRADAAAMRLRHALAGDAPDAVARSLRGVPHEGEAAELRVALATVAPGGVAFSLWAQPGEAAETLRERLFRDVPDEVMGALGTDASPAAWLLRRAWLAANQDALGEYWPARTLCRSLAGLGDDEAWALRERARPAAPVEAIESLRGLADERAFAWRDELLANAPKPVMESLTRLDHPRADAQREAVADRCKEAIDAVVGLDTPAAWALRARHLATWPSTVAGSLGPLAAGARGAAMLAQLLADNPGNLSLWGHAAATIAG
jgi:dTMP kinase